MVPSPGECRSHGILTSRLFAYRYKETIMLRERMNRVLRALLPAIFLAGAMAIPLESRAAHAAVGPKLTLRCFIMPTRYHVSCWTWGNSIAGAEWVHLTYRVTFLTMPKVNGRHPSQTFKRTVKTNGTGILTRTPRISFVTSRHHTTYSVAVTALGAQKDKGATSFLAIGT